MKRLHINYVLYTVDKGAVVQGKVERIFDAHETLEQNRAAAVQFIEEKVAADIAEYEEGQ